MPEQQTARQADDYQACSDTPQTAPGARRNAVEKKSTTYSPEQPQAHGTGVRDITSDLQFRPSAGLNSAERYRLREARAGGAAWPAVPATMAMVPAAVFLAEQLAQASAVLFSPTATQTRDYCARPTIGLPGAWLEVDSWPGEAVAMGCAAGFRACAGRPSWRRRSRRAVSPTDRATTFSFDYLQRALWTIFMSIRRVLDAGARLPDG